MMRRALIAIALAGLTACGSTVQTVTTNGAPVSGPQGDGLTAPAGEPQADAGLATGAVPGSGIPGATGPTGAAGSAVGGEAGSGTVEPGAVGGDAAQTGAAPAGAAPGSVSKTGPVKVGFLNTKVGNAENLGLNAGQTYPTDRVFRALVTAMNAEGGVGGRPIVPVTADTDTASSDWNRDYQAACERLTQDDPVAVVVGYSFAFIDAFESCLAQAGVPHLNGAYTVGDEQSLREFPTLIGTNAISADRRYRLQLEGALREGYVTKTSKIGLLVDECPPQARAVKRTVEPFLQQNGLTEAARTTFSCPAGAGDAGPVASQVQAAVLQFRQRGVDRVFVEGIPLILFAQSAESQGYRPGYLVTSTSGGGALEPNMPAAQLANVHGYGWMPQVDVNPSNQPPKSAAQQRCLALLKSQGVIPSQYNDFHIAYTTCDGLFLYDAALERSRGDERAAAVVSAISSLGTAFAGTGVHSGRTSFAASGREAPVVYRNWSWVGECSCFRYNGGELPIS